MTHIVESFQFQYEGEVTACVCDGDNCNDKCLDRCKAAKKNGNGAGAVRASAAATLITAAAVATLFVTAA